MNEAIAANLSRSLALLLETNGKLFSSLSKTDSKGAFLAISSIKLVKSLRSLLLVYHALGIKADPLGKTKMIVDNKKSVVPTAPP
jgi:hypothetical protein